MEDLFRLILSNPLYTIFVGGVCMVIIFLALKKIIKLLLYAFLFLLIVLAYIYYSGESLTTIVRPVQSVVKKVEKRMQENTAVEEVAKKAGKDKEK
jgi:Ca2+/Na+ antiporter